MEYRCNKSLKQGDDILKNLTPMMKQYLDIKDKYQDCILFFRLGDFYEMFFEDAIETSKLLDITLTARACGNNEKAPMCGVPYHSAKSYIQRLINYGKKVAICEQIQDPKEVKGIVDRAITKIITPGTVLEDEMIQGSSNNYIMSLISNGKNLEISYVDITTGEVNNLTCNYNEIANIFFAVNPSEIIADESFYKKLSSEDFKNSKLISNLIDENNIVQNVISQDSEDFEEFKGKYALEDVSESLSRIYKYVYDTQQFFDKNFFYQRSKQAYMYLDYYTLKNLEIVESIRRNSNNTLFDVLNKTNTSMGSRKLKQNLLKPLNNEKDIKQRLEVLSCFVDDYSFTMNISSILKEIYDLERISNRIVYDSVSQKDLLNLKTSLICIKKLEDIFKEKDNENFALIYENISSVNYAIIIDLIEKSIEEMGEDLKYKHKIKSSFNEKLAYYRKLMENSSDILIKMEAEEREKTGIKNLKINYNKVFGYYIEISKGALQNAKIPEDYERRQTLVSSERFINQSLKEIEQEMLSARQSEVALENSLYAQVKAEIKKYIDRIMRLASVIAELDVYASLSKTAIENDYVKPMIAVDNKLIIKNGRHPVIEKILTDDGFVPNDTIVDDEMTHIITGPNMAGKSTYMRQVALIVLMAHIGSYVPASFASIPIIDGIYTRIGASDDLSMGQSTFMVEMSEVSNILKNATKKSLVILDEIGRGTSTYDGMSLAFAIVEYIASNIKAKTLVSTHYHELTSLESRFDNIKNYCMLVDDATEIKFLKKIVEGKADKSYGIHVAMLADIPYEVLERANVILSRLETKEKKSVSNYKKNSMQEQVSLEDFSKENNLRIVQKIKDINLDEYSAREALELLYEIKESLR